MLKFVISQANLAAIMTATNAIVNEIKMQITEKDIRIEAVDPANVCMVFVKADAAAFDFFQATPGEIALDLARLTELTSGKESISIDLEEETHRLTIRQGKAKYSMSLIDPNAIKAAPRLPTLDMPCSITLPGSDLAEAVRAAGKVSDHVIMAQGESDFSISAKGDIDSFSMKFPLTELTGIRHGESRALFSLDYMEDIAKAAKAWNVTIDSGIDYPAKIAYKAGEAISVMYLLAPRIERDD